MTEIVDLNPPTQSWLTIVRAVRFNPWPFSDETVVLDSDQFIDNEGELLDAVEQGIYDRDGTPAQLTAGEYDVLVVLSDGSVAASTVQGVRAYGRPSPP